jgi:hypothetical protein
MFDIGNASCEPGADSLQQLLDDGFAIIPRVVQPERVPQLSEAYELAVATAPSCDLSLGRTTTRVSNLIDRGQEFSRLHLCPPVLEACTRAINLSLKYKSRRWEGPRLGECEISWGALRISFAHRLEGDRLPLPNCAISSRAQLPRTSHRLRLHAVSHDLHRTPET